MARLWISWPDKKLEQEATERTENAEYDLWVFSLLPLLPPVLLFAYRSARVLANAATLHLSLLTRFFHPDELAATVGRKEVKSQTPLLPRGDYEQGFVLRGPE